MARRCCASCLGVGCIACLVGRVARQAGKRLEGLTCRAVMFLMDSFAPHCMSIHSSEHSRLALSLVERCLQLSRPGYHQRISRDCEKRNSGTQSVENIMDPIETARDTPALVCLIARAMRDANQGHQTVYGGPEIRTRGLELCQRGLSKRQSDLGYLTRSRAKKQTSIGLCCFKSLYIPTSQCSYLFPSRQRSTPPQTPSQPTLHFTHTSPPKPPP